MAVFKDTLALIDKVSEPLKKIKTRAEESTEAIEKAKRANERLQKTYQGLGGALRKFDSKLSVTYAQLDRFSKRTENIKKLGQDVQSVGNKMTIGLTLPIVALGGASVKAAADMEAMQQQLSTMLQSDIKGAEMFDKIKKMAAKTPFGTKDLMSATNTMLGFGIAQEKVLPLMQQLGDISGGNKDRFQSLALAFSQVSAAGKLQGQDLLQMINAGFNPLEAISKRTGKSIGQLKEEMSKGAISVEMVEQAMKDATSEGGRFFKMMDKQSKTALGQWSTMQDNLNQALADFGVQIMPYAIKAIQSFSKLLEWFGSLSPATKRVLIVLGGFVAILGPLVSGIGTLITVIGGLSTAMMFLSANPITLTIAAWTAGIAGVVAVVVLLIKNWGKLVQWVKNGLRWISELVDKLGVAAYLIPGLNAVKFGKDIAGAVSNKINNNSVRQTQNNTTNNSSTVYNYNYGNQQQQAISNMLNPAYALAR